MRKFIIGAILAAVSTSAAADSRIDVLKAESDLRYSIERVLELSGGSKNPFLESYQQADRFYKSIIPQIAFMINNGTSCEVIAANVSSAAAQSFEKFKINQVMSTAIDDQVSKMTIYAMVKCYDLKG